MSQRDKEGFFCELSPMLVASNISAELKQESFFYFKEVLGDKFIVMGYDANGAIKEGEAALIEDHELGEYEVKGFFVEKGKEVKFSIKPFNIFDIDIYFGTGVWSEWIGGDIRQKYNIRIWDATATGFKLDFVSNLFLVNSKLSKAIKDQSESILEHKDQMLNFKNEAKKASQVAGRIALNGERLDESLAKVKSLISDSEKVKSEFERNKTEFEKNKTKFDSLVDSSQKLKVRYQYLENISDTILEKASETQQEADRILGSAVTVQLAKSFKERKEAAASLRAKYDYIFYASLAVGLIIALSLFAFSDFEPVGFWSYVHFFLTRLTLFGVPLWLGVFASKKSSLLTRLEEFYAQKQTLAESYEGYKSRLMEIGDDASEDLIELMRINLLSISRDSQMVIDGAATEKHSPIEQLISLRKNRSNKKPKSAEQVDG